MGSARWSCLATDLLDFATEHELPERLWADSIFGPNAHRKLRHTGCGSAHMDHEQVYKKTPFITRLGQIIESLK
jgi:hypothetical protein